MCLPASALLEPAEAEGGIDGRERRAEKQPALNQRQEWRPKDERDRRLHEPLRERIAAALAQQHALSTKLEPVERANVSLAEPPHFLEDLVRDRAVAEVRIQHLGGDAAVAMATLTPIAPAGLIVCAASPISRSPSRDHSRIRRMMPSSGKKGLKSRRESAKSLKIESKRRTRSATTATPSSRHRFHSPVGRTRPAWTWCGYLGSMSPRTSPRDT